MNPHARDLLLAWSTVNLLFFRRWAQILPGGHDYFLERARPGSQYFALMLLIVLLSAAAWGLLALVRRSKNSHSLPALRAAFLVVAYLGIRGVIIEGWVFAGRPGEAAWIDLALVVLVVGTIGLLQWRRKGWHRRVVPLAVAAMMLFTPLVAILYAQGIYHVATAEAAAGRFTPEYGPPLDETPAGGRVVWIVFDEMDQRITFEERPQDVALPELEALRAESLYATHAYAPNAATMRSVPSFTTGSLVEYARARGIRDVTLRASGASDTFEWRTADTVFHRARDAGHDVGVVGTYHPYCRIFGEVLARCHFESHFQEERGFGALMAEHLVMAARVLPGVHVRDGVVVPPGPFGDSFSSAQQRREIATYEGIHGAALDMVADPGLDFVYLHYNVPHPTGGSGEGRGFYDPGSGEFVTGAGTSYLDNLALTDRTFGELRQAMESNGTWNNTTLIVTADHGYRYALWGESESTRRHGDVLHKPTDHRVAFLYKPAGHEGDGVQYDDPFNNIVLADLVIATLAGDVATNDEAAAWLDEHGTGGPAPSYVIY